MSDFLDRLRTGLSRGPRVVRLGWHGRQRRRFLHEYHEMRARSGADLFHVDGRLVWRGTIPLRTGEAEVVVCYHRAHPAVAPSVYVLSPDSIVPRLPRRPDGSLALLAPRDHHAGLTAYDFWTYAERVLRELDAAY